MRRVLLKRPVFERDVFRFTRQSQRVQRVCAVPQEYVAQAFRELDRHFERRPAPLLVGCTRTLLAQDDARFVLIEDVSSYNGRRLWGILFMPADGVYMKSESRR